MIIGAFAGFLLSGLLPIPPAAHLGAAEIAAFYGESPNLSRAGFVLVAMSVGLILPLVGLIGVHMVRMEGRTPVLAFTQLACGAVTAVMLLVPMLVMAVCAFRPERDPQLILLLNDLAWLLFIPPIAPFMIQNVAIGLAVLGDRNPEPLLPRWVAYLNFWVAFLFVPDVLAFFFVSGPFAWQGIFVFWLALTAYTVWVLTMSFVLLRLVRREAAAAPVEPVAA